MQQPAAALQRLDDELAGLVELHAADQRHVGLEAPIAQHRVDHRQAVAAADDVVVLAMRRRGVHGAGAGLERHVIAEDHRHLPILERMLQLQSFEQLGLRNAPASRDIGGAVARQAGIGQPFGQHHDACGALRAARSPPARIRYSSRSATASLAGSVQGVVVQMTTCRLCDVGIDGSAGALREIRDINHAEGHVDGRRGLVLVFHFGLGQRRAAVQAPVHGLGAAIEVAVGDDLAQRADLLRLVLRIHREIGLIPVAQHAQALEILALQFDLLHGIGAAGGAKRARIQLLPDAAVLLLHLRARWAGRGSPSPGCRARRSHPACAT